jgi:hypothetical protein
MKAQGLAPEVVKDELDKIAAALAEGDFAYPVEAFRDNPIIARWVAFRQQSVTGLVERILKNAKENIGDIHFWLDLWPPAYSWILGQDYRADASFRHAETLPLPQTRWRCGRAGAGQFLCQR